MTFTLTFEQNGDETVCCQSSVTSAVKLPQQLMLVFDDFSLILCEHIIEHLNNTVILFDVVKMKVRC